MARVVATPYKEVVLDWVSPGNVQLNKVLRPQTKVWTSKYLNNQIEQDHRRVKQRLSPMLGFKNFRNAAVTISGVELEQKIRKGQFDTSAVIAGEGSGVTQMWEAVLAA